MHGTLVTPDNATGVSTVSDPDADSIAASLAHEAHFWLDLDSIDADTLDLLRRPFGFHPLAVEDAEHFGQRPKIETYDDFTLIVVYGTTVDGEAVEVHCFYTEHFLVTVHRGDVPELDATIARLKDRDAPLPSPILLLHRVVDTLVDSYFPALDSLDDAIDGLEDAILRRPTEAQLGELFRLKRTLGTVRRLAGETRDAFATMELDDALPGMTPSAERYFRDVYDHLARSSQTADYLRDLLMSAMDTHLSTTSNRLNVVMKQLTIIATVFLPLSFVTGFFGQNFAWMVDRVGGFWAFVVGGIGVQVLVALVLVAMFKRKGWIGRTADR